MTENERRELWAAMTCGVTTTVPAWREWLRMNRGRRLTVQNVIDGTGPGCSYGTARKRLEAEGWVVTVPHRGIRPGPNDGFGGTIPAKWEWAGGNK